jgi:hypothetical protein
MSVRQRRQSLSPSSATEASNKRAPSQKVKPMAKPETVVARSSKKKLKVRWYGGGNRQVEVVTGIRNWFKSGFGTGLSTLGLISKL